MECWQTPTQTLPPAVEWLDRFASQASGVRADQRSAGELQHHLQAFCEALTAFDTGLMRTPSAPLSRAKPQCTSLSDNARRERAALIGRVSEMMYVVGQFASSPSLSDVWIRGQVRRFVDSYHHLCDTPAS